MSLDPHNGEDLVPTVVCHPTSARLAYLLGAWGEDEGQRRFALEQEAMDAYLRALGMLPPVARETHWDCAITQPFVDGACTATHVECGCGWTWETPRTNAAAITRARRMWDDHDCAGRPFPETT